MFFRRVSVGGSNSIIRLGSHFASVNSGDTRIVQLRFGLSISKIAVRVTPGNGGESRGDVFSFRCCLSFNSYALGRLLAQPCVKLCYTKLEFLCSRFLGQASLN